MAAVFGLAVFAREIQGALDPGDIYGAADDVYLLCAAAAAQEQRVIGALVQVLPGRGRSGGCRPAGQGRGGHG
jgi:hypothetical protein